MANSALRGVRLPPLPTVSTEVAMVWRVGRRRYFAKQSAARAMARQWIAERCDCEKADWETGWPDQPCKYHADSERLAALMSRLTDLAKAELRSSRSSSGKRGTTNG